jgi:hypothetical protein
MSKSPSRKRRWGIGQRLEFIEGRLFWDGTLNRSDIAERFGVSAPQVSSDLRLYKKIAPHNLNYDPSEKRFYASSRFRSRVQKPNADRYLVQLKAIADGVIAVTDTNIGRLPPFDAMPIPHRRVDPMALRELLRIIYEQKGVQIFYHSMNSSRPLPLWRDITPHALAFDGLRWHVRAYCHLEARFKDFVLSRILNLGNEVPPGKKSHEDQHWLSFFIVELVPNPQLGDEQRRTVALDYEMTEGRLRIPVRRALLYYFNKRLRLDVAEKADVPKETPIVLANRVEFENALKLAGA